MRRRQYYMPKGSATMIQQRFYRHFFFMVLLALLCSWIPGAALAKAPLTAAVPARASPSLVPNNVANSVPAPHAVLANPAKTTTASAPARTRSIGALPLAFVANAGQSDSAVRFLVRSRGGTFFFTPAEAVLAVPILDPNAPFVDRGRRSGQTARVAGTTVVRLQYQGANPARALRAGERLLGVVNYLVGTNPNQWRTNLATYASVSYAQLYTGIDLRYEGVDGQLKRTYAVAAGANPANIRWRYAGATAAQLDPATGDLVITLPAPAAGLPGATLTERAPIAWQDSGGQRIPVSVRYDVAPNGSIGFVLGAYDTTQPLTIDPVLSYSTFLGGNVIDEGSGITVDSSGNAYIVGGSYSSNFPTAGALQGTRAGSEDVIVSKVSADGTTLLYSTFLGGSGEDEANALALDASGNIVLAGETASSNFPTQNALDSTFGGGACTGAPCNDAVIVKLNAAGNALLYSTYLGGSGTEEGNGVAVDSSGMIYATGVITSTTGVTMTNAYDSSQNGGSDAFVVKLNPALSGNSSLLYSTYLGGGADDQGNAIAVDTAGAVYVGGETYSRSTTPFPTQNAFQSTKGSGSSSSDAFVTKLNPALSGSASLLYSSYLGGAAEDRGFGIARDGAGILYLTGLTRSSAFPTTSPIQNSIGGGTCGTVACSDVFVTQFDLAHNTLGWSTYLGGNNDDEGDAIAVDSSAAAYLTGKTASTNFPTTTGARHGTYGGGSHDAFVAKIGASTATNGTITLTPAGATNVRGTTQTLQATLNDQQGAPISGIAAQFTVSGPNETSGSATTNASGVASFTYTGNITGTDTVQATASVGGAPIASNVAHIGWITPLQPVATTTIWGRFFFNPGNTGAFSAA